MYMEVSKNSGTPKSSILIEFSNINHPFLGDHGTSLVFRGLQMVTSRPPSCAADWRQDDDDVVCPA